MAFGLENKMSSGIDINNYKSYWSAHSLNTDFIFFFNKLLHYDSIPLNLSIY